MAYARILDNRVQEVVTCNPDEIFTSEIALLFEFVEDQIGVGDIKNSDGSFTPCPPPPPTPEPTLAPDPTAFLIDTGPFFDRFGTSKLPILMSADPLVKALMADIQIRKWIDLQRPDVAQALDILVGKTLLTAELKAAILEHPVEVEENRVLKKLYFA